MGWKNTFEMLAKPRDRRRLLTVIIPITLPPRKIFVLTKIMLWREFKHFFLYFVEFHCSHIVLNSSLIVSF